MDLFRYFFTGRNILQKELMNGLIQRSRLGRFIMTPSGSAPLTSRHGTVAAITSEATFQARPDSIRTKLIGDIASTPFLVGLAREIPSQFANISGADQRPVTAYVIEYGTDPFTGQDSLLSTTMHGLANRSSGHITGITGSSIESAPRGRYSMPGAWLSACRRPRSARAFYLYHTGILSGGTFRLGYNGVWSSPLSYLASNGQVSSALLSIGLTATVGTVGNGFFPMLIVLTGASAGLMSGGVSIAVDSQVTGLVDLLGRHPTVLCAAVTIPRSPGAMYYDVGDMSEAFTLSWLGQTTATLAAHEPSFLVKAALEALSSVGAGNVFVEEYNWRPSGGHIYTMPATTETIRGYLISFIGNLEDISHWNDLIITGGGANGDRNVSPTNAFWRSPQAAYESSIGEYWDEWVTYDTIINGVAEKVSGYSGSVIGLDATATPVHIFVPSESTSFSTLVLTEYGYPGGFILWGGPHRRLAGQGFFRNTGLNWVDSRPKLEFQKRETIEMENAGMLAFPPALSGQINFSLQFDNLLIKPHTTAALRSALANEYQPALQRPPLEPWKMTQPCIISDAVGRPYGIADGYLDSPRHGDPVSDSAYGQQAYVWLEAGGDARVAENSFPPHTTFGDLGTVGNASFVNGKALLFRSGTADGLCFRTGVPAALPSVIAPCQLAGGATVQDAFSSILTGKNAYQWSVVWDYVTAANPYTFPSASFFYRVTLDIPAIHTDGTLTLSIRPTFSSAIFPVSVLIDFTLGAGLPRIDVSLFQSALDASMPGVWTVSEFVAGGGWSYGLDYNMATGNPFDTVCEVSSNTSSATAWITHSFPTEFQPYTPNQSRTVGEAGLGVYGLISNGMFRSGPALGQTPAYSQRDNPIDSLGRYFGGRQVWYSGKSSDDGYASFLFAGVLTELTSLTSMHWNVPFPLKMILSVTGISDTVEGDGACIDGLTVDMESTGIDVFGLIGYGAAPENNPATLAQTANFQTGLVWTGHVESCGHTLYFLLVASVKGVDYSPGSDSTGVSNDGGGYNLPYMMARIFVYCDAAPTWPPPQMLRIQDQAGTFWLTLRTSSCPWILPPGLVGVSEITWIQRPLDDVPNYSGSWNFHVPIGSFGRPSAARCVANISVDDNASPGFVYGPFDVDSGCDFSGTSLQFGSADDYFANYSNVNVIGNIPGRGVMFGRCCSVGNVRLTLTDASAGIYGEQNLFDRFVAVSGLVCSLSVPHARGWKISTPVSGVDVYLAIVQPDALGGFSIMFASYNRDSDWIFGGICQYSPINAMDPATNFMSGALSWNGSCATFSASGTVYLNEPGVGQAKINVSVTL